MADTERDLQFEAWRDSLPPTHWAKYDLAACRLGWDAALAAPGAEPRDATNKELREALERSNTALNDWLNLYTPELCDPVRVGEAQARVGAVGTIAYIAEVTAQNRAALVKP